MELQEMMNGLIGSYLVELSVRMKGTVSGSRSSASPRNWR